MRKATSRGNISPICDAWNCVDVRLLVLSLFPPASFGSDYARAIISVLLLISFLLSECSENSSHEGITRETGEARRVRALGLLSDH